MFSYQSSLFLSQRQLIYNIISISLCQQFFYFCFKSRCHHRSLEGGCPDDKWYLTTSIQNCQCCFYYFFNSEYSDISIQSVPLHVMIYCDHTILKLSNSFPCVISSRTSLRTLIKENTRAQNLCRNPLMQCRGKSSVHILSRRFTFIRMLFG